MPKFLQIRSDKFPILPGEEEELHNPETYGKGFALYLQSSLAEQAYDTPFICCEDWGWWVDIKLPNKAIGLCCYRHGEEDGMCELVCSPSPEGDRVWSWRHFRFIDLSKELRRLEGDLETLFVSDPDVEFIGSFDEFPY